jgi:hypothetical protein
LKIFGCLYFTYYQRNADITNYVFWDITTCGQLKANWHYRGIHYLHLLCQRIRQTKNQHEADSKQLCVLTASCYFFLGYSMTLKMGVTCSSKMLVDFHTVMSHKTELFITTTVGIWSHTFTN